MKLWLKTIKGEKITADTMLEISERITPDTLTAALRDKLLDLDLPTPVILPLHINKMKSFNIVRFKGDDFVEYTHFDTMVIEVIKEDDKRRKSYV